jgi:Spy/CpxP family protein refolding chaperone
MRTRTLIISIIAVLSIMALAFAQQAPADRPGFGRGFGPGQGQGPGFGMLVALDLTDAQQADISKLRTEHMKKMELYRADMQKLRTEHKLAMIDDNYSEAKVNKSIDAMSDLRVKMDKERAAFLHTVRGKLTAEQKDKMDQFVLSNKGRGGRGGRGGHGPRGGGKGLGPCGQGF